MSEEREEQSASAPEAAEAAPSASAEAPAAEPSPASVEPGPERVSAPNREIEEWRARAYRAAADLDNFRKRALKDREEARKYAIEGVLRDLIPVADNLERALAHGGASGSALGEGVAMILKQYLGALEKHGAKPFDPKGELFDPQFHEAMSQMPRDGVEPGTVIEVYQRGWMLHDRLVRPAMVVISTGEPAAAAPEAPAGEGGSENGNG